MENVLERMERIDGKRKIADFIVKQKMTTALRSSMQPYAPVNLYASAICATLIITYR